jgi:hypothetical protein
VRNYYFTGSNFPISPCPCLIWGLICMRWNFVIMKSYSSCASQCQNSTVSIEYYDSCKEQINICILCGWLLRKYYQTENFLRQKKSRAFYRQMHAVQFMSTSLVSERLKSYPRVSEISLSCTFAGVRLYISQIPTNIVPLLRQSKHIYST